MLIPNLNTLTPPQKLLISKLSHIPESFVLYGQGAFALRLGHREITSFEFFTNDCFDPLVLVKKIPFLQEAELSSHKENFLVCQVKISEIFDEHVRLEFYGDRRLDRISDPDPVDKFDFRVASLLDVAGTWMMAVQNRDYYLFYLDVASFLQQGVTLSQALAAAKAIYRTSFIPRLSITAMTYFIEDDEHSPLTFETKQNLMSAIKAVDLSQLPELTKMPGLFS